MTTRFDQLAAAFPLHIQRIMECASEQQNSTGDVDTWRNSPPDHDAGWSLYDAFDWSRTSEGTNYWYALAEGARKDGFPNCPCGGWDCSGVPGGPLYNCPYLKAPRT
jgi:hypothetical protein